MLNDIDMDMYIKAMETALNRNLFKDEKYKMNNIPKENGYCEWELENELDTPWEGSFYRLEHIFTILETSGLTTLCMLRDIYSEEPFFKMLYNLYSTEEIEDRFEERQFHFESLAIYFWFKSMLSMLVQNVYGYNTKNKVVATYYYILSELCEKLSKCSLLVNEEKYVYDIEDAMVDAIYELPKNLDNVHFSDFELMEEFINNSSLNAVLNIEDIEKSIDKGLELLKKKTYYHIIIKKKIIFKAQYCCIYKNIS